MQVLDLEEQDDGSAIVTLDLTWQELHFFVELGVLEAIKRGSDETKKGLAEAAKESGAVGEGSSVKSLHLQEPEEGVQADPDDDFTRGEHDL